MSNKEYIENLINMSIECPSGMNDDDILKLYNDIQAVFKSDKYTDEEKILLYTKAHLESLAMMI